MCTPMSSTAIDGEWSSPLVTCSCCHDPPSLVTYQMPAALLPPSVAMCTTPLASTAMEWAGPPLAAKTRVALVQPVGTAATGAASTANAAATRQERGQTDLTTVMLHLAAQPGLPAEPGPSPKGTGPAYALRSCGRRPRRAVRVRLGALSAG